MGGFPINFNSEASVLFSDDGTVQKGKSVVGSDFPGELDVISEGFHFMGFDFNQRLGGMSLKDSRAFLSL